jgi:hypothetical protein
MLNCPPSDPASGFVPDVDVVFRRHERQRCGGDGVGDIDLAADVGFERALNAAIPPHARREPPSSTRWM